MVCLRRRWTPLLASLASALAVLSLSAPAAPAATGMKIGFYDEGLTLWTDGDSGYAILDDLGAQVLRLNLYWYEVAKSRPQRPTDPGDPAYDWSLYDRALASAGRHGIEVLLSVFGTPGWANGGRAFQYAPRSFADLRAFATAAARRYPQVRLWMAWNEPNAPNFLKPQSARRGGRWFFSSPATYARICNAVVDGVNAAHAGDTVACGGLNPRGKLRPNGLRDSVAPVLFLKQMKQAGARPEVIAHHPYAPSPRISPTARIHSKTTVTLGNLDTLIAAVDRLYGRRMRIWITEYGYQTNPPDRLFGVSWARQASWMRIAFERMRRNPRIDLALWFQLQDDSRPQGWQSGVISTDGVRKPSYAAFKRL